MKIQSRDIPHKSEVGGVRVNIATKGEAFATYQALLENARKHRPDAAIQGVLVGPMAKKGVEIIVGTMLDATFGPMVMVGLGGITTELFRDVIYRPAPVGAAEASAMLGELKAAPLLERLPGRGESRCSGAGAIDRADFRAGGAISRRDFGDRDQSGAGASRRAGRDDRGCAGGAEEVTRELRRSAMTKIAIARRRVLGAIATLCLAGAPSCALAADGPGKNLGADPAAKCAALSGARADAMQVDTAALVEPKP